MKLSNKDFQPPLTDQQHWSAAPKQNHNMLSYTLCFYKLMDSNITYFKDIFQAI